MPSPFPGMDPYIEASGRWLGFHEAFIAACQEVLNRHLPANYAATFEEHVRLVNLSEEQWRGVRPDVAIVANLFASGDAAHPHGSVATLVPQTLHLAESTVEEIRESYVEVRHLP